MQLITWQETLLSIYISSSLFSPCCVLGLLCEVAVAVEAEGGTQKK